MKIIIIILLIFSNLRFLYCQIALEDTTQVKLSVIYNDSSQFNQQIIIKDKKWLIIEIDIFGDYDNSIFKKEDLVEKINVQKQILENIYIQNVDSVYISGLYVPADFSRAVLNWDQIKFLAISSQSTIDIATLSKPKFTSGIQTLYIRSGLIKSKSKINLQSLDLMKVEVLDIGLSNIQFDKKSIKINEIRLNYPSGHKVWVYQSKFLNLKAIYFVPENYRFPNETPYKNDWFEIPKG